MKSIETKVKRVVVAKLEKGDKVLDCIARLVREHDIRGGLVNIIGAFSKIQIGFFELDRREYKWIELEEDVEFISGMGNIAWADGEPVVHLHFAVGRNDGSVLGGHCGPESTISVTGEVYILETDAEIHRAKDPTWDLNLLDL
ncbi:MAG: PPC domain-containing DNA-binding protein [Promethearchaeota archaeon]